MQTAYQDITKMEEWHLYEPMRPWRRAACESEGKGQYREQYKNTTLKYGRVTIIRADNCGPLCLHKLTTI